MTNWLAATQLVTHLEVPGMFGAWLKLVLGEAEAALAGVQGSGVHADVVAAGHHQTPICLFHLLVGRPAGRRVREKHLHHAFCHLDVNIKTFQDQNTQERLTN